jgi:hypothetical protein
LKRKISLFDGEDRCKVSEAVRVIPRFVTFGKGMVQGELE